MADLVEGEAQSDRGQKKLGTEIRLGKCSELWESKNLFWRSAVLILGRILRGISMSVEFVATSMAVYGRLSERHFSRNHE
jgi:hypothetical protein